MKLKSLSLRNFKGVKGFTLPANGENINVYGANRAGKTTTYDAFLWLLLGKDSQDQKDFGIKPFGQSSIDTEVEATLMLPTGELALKKIYKEVWTKKRGSATAEFTGHNTEHYVNGVPAKKSEYDITIRKLIDEQIFKMLTNPRQFTEVTPWRSRRMLLMEMCGVSSGDISKQADAVKVAKAKQAEINKRLQDLPVRIDEANRGLPEAVEVAIDITSLRHALSVIQENKATLTAGGATAHLTKELRQLESDLMQAQNQQRGKIDTQVDDVRRELSSLRDEIEKQTTSRTRKIREITQKKGDIEAYDKLRTNLRNTWKTVTAEEFTGAGICPTCKQNLPEEMIEESKTAFNLNKSKTLEDINKTGTDAKDKTIKLQAEITALEQEIATIDGEMAELRLKETTLTAKLQALNGLINEVAELPECLDIKGKITAKKGQIDAVGKGIDTSAIDTEMATIRGQIADAEKVHAQNRQREDGLKRVDDLKAEEKKLAGEYEALQGKLYREEQGLTSLIKSLEERINSMFELVSFRMFKTLINGGIEECCEVTLKSGVEYGDMSNSEKIKAGLDIIRTLAKHYKQSIPVFVDNRESITEIPGMGDIQVISLFVSPDDKVLRIEKGE